MGAIARSLIAVAAALAVAAPLCAKEPALEHSPWLALRFEQDGAGVPITAIDTLRSEVTLKKRPFTIVLPVRGEDDAYLLTAWTSDSIFADALPDERARAWTETELPFYFTPYTAMADTAAGSGTLMLNAEGHHHLSGLRLGPDRDRHAVSFAQVLEIDGAERREYAMRKVDGPLYLVVWFDEDGDGVMRHGEYEFLELDFR